MASRSISLWPVLLGLCVVLHIISVVDAKDNNPIYDPCADVAPLGLDDHFSFAVALGGDPDKWYNLSPCDPNLVGTFQGSPVQMAVFHAKVDELTLLRFNNVSLLNLRNNFVNNSLLVYSGSRPAQISEAKVYRNRFGQVPTLSLVFDLDKGRLRSTGGILWKDDDCKTCSGTLCFNNGKNCAIAEQECVNSENTDPNLCRLGIQLAWSGTDKDDRPLRSWYQLDRLRRYSLTDIYGQAKRNVDNAVGNVADDADAITRA